MKKFLLMLTLVFSANAAFADCNIKNIGLGKNFSELKEKYKMNNDFVGSNKYYKNIRGKEICPALEGAEVSILFLKDKMAQILIYKKTSNSVVLDIASNNFGKPEKLPNKDDPELDSYSTFWDDNENAMAYSFSLSKNKGVYTEKLSMQNKVLADEYTKFAATDEGTKEQDNEEDDEHE
jgi:hypothetical protein